MGTGSCGRAQILLIFPTSISTVRCLQSGMPKSPAGLMLLRGLGAAACLGLLQALGRKLFRGERLLLVALSAVCPCIVRRDGAEAADRAGSFRVDLPRSTTAAQAATATSGLAQFVRHAEIEIIEVDEGLPKSGLGVAAELAAKFFPTPLQLLQFVMGAHRSRLRQFDSPAMNPRQWPRLT